MRVYLAVLLITISAVGSGWHSNAPLFAYLSMGLIIFTLTIDRDFFWRYRDFLDPKIALGVFLFNIFFWLRATIYPIAPEYYFVNLISLGSYLLAFGALRYLSTQLPAKTILISICLGCLLGILLILAAQALEIYGYIDPADLALKGDDASFFQRPGGFLNTNQSAADALVFAFSGYLCSERLTRWAETKAQTLIAVCLFSSIFVAAAIVIFLTQSRAGIAFFAVLCVFAFRKRAVLALAGIFALWLVLGGSDEGSYFSTHISQLSLERFQGDTSSSERAWVMEYAINRFLDSPWLGNGYRFLEQEVGFASHNEIIEQLANFGIVGSVVVGASTWLMYRRLGWPVWLICVPPQFIFTHNFYESTCYQMPLALAAFTYMYTRQVRRNVIPVVARPLLSPQTQHLRARRPRLA